MDLLSEAEAVGAAVDSSHGISAVDSGAAAAEDEVAGFRSFGGIEEFDQQEQDIRNAQGTHQSATNHSVDGAKSPLSGPEGLVAQLRADIIGGYHSFTGPFGAKPCVYADWTASGRAVKQV